MLRTKCQIIICAEYIVQCGILQGLLNLLRKVLNELKALLVLSWFGKHIFMTSWCLRNAVGSYIFHVDCC